MWTTLQLITADPHAGRLKVSRHWQAASSSLAHLVRAWPHMQAWIFKLNASTNACCSHGLHEYSWRIWH